MASWADNVVVTTTNSPSSKRPRTNRLPHHHNTKIKKLRPQCGHTPKTQQKGRPRISAETASDLRKRWSGRQDLNLRPLDPQDSRRRLSKHRPDHPAPTGTWS
ncbi:hypothetical protein SCOCK_630008 [Actinacidiphila cocklensis]|uniref:Uncharacterized protein n=1 Tax=Actinacidiphila cocklensis TaxID=887465 RepID=A0A9W4DX57_9ACTN|nr:hypothetical protein SCOCK_630008 [Actinacidiphila cocklensis]